MTLDPVFGTRKKGGVSMAICVYDNPVTMQRECWRNGNLRCAYSYEVIIGATEIPSKYFFFGANIGSWVTGQIVGDPKALRNW